MDTKCSKASLSIVVPCFNEEEVLPATYARLKELSEKWQKSGLILGYELVFVNNASTDGTLDLLIDFHERDKMMVVLDLRKNFGFQGSIMAGLAASSNDMVVSIDADLQDDPEKIEEMVQKYYEGYDMVLGIRKNRDADSFLKRFTAESFYKILNFIGIQSVYNHADFRLLSRGIVNELKKFPERVRYLRGLIFEIESKYVCVYYDRRRRELGKSKFSWSSLFSFALDGITSFSSVPIRIVSAIGLSMFFIAILGSIAVLYAKYVLAEDVPGWAFLSIIILFFGGVQNLSLGIIGEYIAKIFLETKQRPVYIVRRTYRHDAPSGE